MKKITTFTIISLIFILQLGSTFAFSNLLSTSKETIIIEGIRLNKTITGNQYKEAIDNFVTKQNILRLKDIYYKSDNIVKQGKFTGEFQSIFKYLRAKTLEKIMQENNLNNDVIETLYQLNTLLDKVNDNSIKNIKEAAKNIQIEWKDKRKVTEIIIKIEKLKDKMNLDKKLNNNISNKLEHILLIDYDKKNLNNNTSKILAVALKKLLPKNIKCGEVATNCYTKLLNDIKKLSKINDISERKKIGNQILKVIWGTKELNSSDKIKFKKHLKALIYIKVDTTDIINLK